MDLKQFDTRKTRRPAEDGVPRESGLSLDAVAGVFFTLARITAIVMGFALLIIGMVSAVKLYGFLFTGIQNPEPFSRLLEQWVQVYQNYFTGAEITPPVEFGYLPPFVFLGLILFLGWFCIILISTGARIIFWFTLKNTTADASATAATPKADTSSHPLFLLIPLGVILFFIFFLMKFLPVISK